MLLFGMIVILTLLHACKKEPVFTTPNVPVDFPPGNVLPNGATVIDPTPQRPGDPVAGWDYLINGDYVSSGIPRTIFTTFYGTDNTNRLGRTGDNANITHEFTSVLHKNGAKIVTPNCLQCHASEIDGEFVVGLGNPDLDFTNDQSALIPGLDQLITIVHGTNSDEWRAYEQFRKSVLATGPHLVTETVGANTADMIGAVLASHRYADDLTWSDVPLIPLPPPGTTAPTDVPPWWHLKKKNAMFYAGVGQGDFSKFLMASSLLTLEDTSEARVIDDRFPDILAYINTIEAPEYTGTVNTALLPRGKSVYETTCKKCHGTYGDTDTYPNLLIDLSEIQTDPLLASANFSSNGFVNWYNSSWFSTTDNPGTLAVTNGYIAPPLDGIWATPPYLHNGSIPTLMDLLDSSRRPTYFKRGFNPTDYDHTNVGWNYSVETSKTSKEVYDTTTPGFGNQGHYYGDGLTQSDREALIEYLKTI